MDIDENEMEYLAKNMTLEQWKGFADKAIDLHEREVAMLMRHIRSVEKLSVADKDNLNTLREVIQQDLDNISTLKRITQEMKNAKTKISRSTPETTKASQPN